MEDIQETDFIVTLLENTAYLYNVGNFMTFSAGLCG